MVLLDGVPIHDHEDILKYNPRLVKKIEIYNGRYGFGGEVFECMISLTTQRGDLPSIQLSDDSRLTVYECPQLPVTFKMPEYKDATDKNHVDRISAIRYTGILCRDRSRNRYHTFILYF